MTRVIPVISRSVGIWRERGDTDQGRRRGQERQQQREPRTTDLDEHELVQRIRDRGGQQSRYRGPAAMSRESENTDASMRTCGTGMTGARTTAANDIPTARESRPSPVSATRLPSRMYPAHIAADTNANSTPVQVGIELHSGQQKHAQRGETDGGKIASSA